MIKLRLRSRIFHGHTSSKQRVCTFLEEPTLWQAEQWQQWPAGQIQQISILVLTFVLTSYLDIVNEPLWLSQLTSLDLSFLICQMRTLLPDVSLALLPDVWHSTLSRRLHTMMLLLHLLLLGLQSQLFWISHPPLPGTWSYSQDSGRIPGVWGMDPWSRAQGLASFLTHYPFSH